MIKPLILLSLLFLAPFTFASQIQEGEGLLAAKNAAVYLVIPYTASYDSWMKIELSGHGKVVFEISDGSKGTNGAYNYYSLAAFPCRTEDDCAPTDAPTSEPELMGRRVFVANIAGFSSWFRVRLIYGFVHVRLTLPLHTR